MERRIKKLKTEKELKIFMDPLRQRMLRTMEILSVPVTPKKLADVMAITPSSAKHHLTQLESIGLVAVDHTEQIHGITATFYKTLPMEVHIGLDESEYADERGIIAENLLMSVYAGFRGKIKGRNAQPPFRGEMLTGVIHLTQEQADKLHDMIRRFIRENETPSAGTIPFEYALILYNAGAANEKSL